MKTLVCAVCDVQVEVRRRGMYCGAACRQKQYRQRRRISRYMSKYQMGEARAAMWEAKRERGPCELCGAQGKLVVDHDHQTGVIRGILCGSCNSLTEIIDSFPPARRDKVAAYLERGKVAGGDGDHR